MLIIPLHRVAGRPLVGWWTLALIAVNVLVFTILQGGDERVRAEAVEHYVEVGLVDVEAGLYQRYLEQRDDADAQAQLAWVLALPDPMRAELLSRRIDLDPRFQRWAGAAGAFEDETGHAEWRRHRTGYETLLARSVTERFMLRGNEIDPLRMLTAAFLHGDLAHLLGNMLFLFILGNLVEAVLGAWRYLALYFAAALCASLASLAWRWGEPSAGLGASGAIAGLMGAYCVLWGRARVRFFYWFFVVFDYVRAPAIWLLPAWLGWEVLQMLWSSDSGIAFEAHAGGLAGGALLALGIQRLGGLDASRFTLADDPAAPSADAKLASALDHLGRMQLERAEALLGDLLGTRPDWFEARLAHYRVARCSGDRARTAERAAALLALRPARLHSLHHQVEVLAEVPVATVDPSGCLRLGVAEALVNAGDPAAARTLLETFDAGIAASPPAAAALWFRLALLEGRSASDQAALLRELLDRFPGSEEARKADFLLSQGATG